MIDSHAQLTADAFDTDRAAMLQRALDAGVEKIVVVGLGDAGAARAIELAARYSGRLFVMVGLDPNDAEAFGETTIDELRDRTAHPQVVGIACVLDYHGGSDARRDAQLRVLKAQLELARELKLPFGLQCRGGDGPPSSAGHAGEDAYHAAARIIGEVFHTRFSEHDRGHERIGVAHAFTGDLRSARALIKLGLYLSFPGSITFRDSDGLREVARAINIDHCVVEGNASDLAPPKRNESASAMATAATLAEAKGLAVADIDRITTRNCNALFGPAFAGDIEGALHKRTVAYPIRGQLYINLTNRCDCRCVFCPRESFPVARGHWLGMREEDEPSVDEVQRAIIDKGGVRSATGGPGVGAGTYGEAVFCGFGEPTIRLAALVAIGHWLRKHGCRVRLNTNGHGNLIHGRDITPDLEGAVDVVSISLNAQDDRLYNKLMRPDLQGDNYAAMKAFTVGCKARIPEVVMTALDGFPGVDMPACEAIATNELGVSFRWREYEEIG